MENTEEKFKCYTVKHDNSTFYSKDTDYIFDELRPMLEDQLKEDEEPMQFEFGVKFLTQSEIDALGEFDGF